MTRLLLWSQTPAQCWQKAVSVPQGPSFTGLILLSVFLKKNVVYLDVIFFFILCKLVVRYFTIHKLSSGLVLCEFWIYHSFEDSRYSVNINCAGEQAGNVLVTHSFAPLLSAGGWSSKSLLKFMYPVILSVLVLASFSLKPFAKGLTFWYPVASKWHAAAVNYTFWIIHVCVLPAFLFIFIAILPHHTK